MAEARKGRQTPTSSLVLPYEKTLGPEAIALYHKTGRTAQEWQELQIYDLMALNDDGLWVHTKYGFEVPRRNGKNEIVAIMGDWLYVNPSGCTLQETPTEESRIVTIDELQDEITALQGQHRLLATGEIVPPIAGGAGISTISADLIHPAPEAGDYIAGSNGYIGHVIGVSNGEATVRGTGIAISEGVPVDVSAAYAAQSDYDTPDRYLASLNANGRYFVADGYSVCVAQLRVVADVSFCRVQQLTDDAKRRAFF